MCARSHGASTAIQRFVGHSARARQAHGQSLPACQRAVSLMLRKRSIRRLPRVRPLALRGTCGVVRVHLGTGSEVSGGPPPTFADDDDDHTSRWRVRRSPFRTGADTIRIRRSDCCGGYGGRHRTIAPWVWLRGTSLIRLLPTAQYSTPRQSRVSRPTVGPWVRWLWTSYVVISGFGMPASERRGSMTSLRNSSK